MACADCDAPSLSFPQLVAGLCASYEKLSNRRLELELENATLRRLATPPANDASVLPRGDEPGYHNVSIPTEAWNMDRLPSVARATEGAPYGGIAIDNRLEDTLSCIKRDLLSQVSFHRLEMQTFLEQQHRDLSATVTNYFVRVESSDRGGNAKGKIEPPDKLGTACHERSETSAHRVLNLEPDDILESTPIDQEPAEGRNWFRWCFFRDQKKKSPGKTLLSNGGDDSPFDVMIGLVILLNACVLCVQAEWNGWRLSAQLGMVDEDTRWENAEFWFSLLEHVFTIIFVIELLVRLSLKGTRFFCLAFNVFDMLIVLSSVTDSYILQPLTNSKAFGNVTVFRFLRMARLVRALRMVRTFRLFGGLRVLVKAVASSMMSLGWSMVMLFIFMTIGGLFTVNLTSYIVEDPNEDMQLRLWTWQHYGTSARALYTMFEITMSGCWPNYVRPLLDAGHHGYAIWFMFYVSFVVFAIIRVITAIFIKETLDAANSDAEMMCAEYAKKKHGYLQKLQAVFKAADTSNDGKISFDEFTTILHDPAICTYLQALELEVHEGKALFHMLDNGDGQITYDEFIKGVSRLKGQARSIDLISLQLDSEHIVRTLNELRSVICPRHLDIVDPQRKRPMISTAMVDGMAQAERTRNETSNDPDFVSI